MLRVLRPSSDRSRGDFPRRPCRARSSWRTINLGKSRACLRLMLAEKRRSLGFGRPTHRQEGHIVRSAPRRMATAFPLGRRASGGYHTDRTRNGHGTVRWPWYPGGGNATRKTPAANTSIRDFEQVTRSTRGPAMGNGQSVNSPIWFLQVFTEVLPPGNEVTMADDDVIQEMDLKNLRSRRDALGEL